MIINKHNNSMTLAQNIIISIIFKDYSLIKCVDLIISLLLKTFNLFNKLTLDFKETERYILDKIY